MVTFEDKPYQINAGNFLDDFLDKNKYGALFMAPGTGKTRVALKKSARLFIAGKIDVVVVLAPNPVKTNWVSWDHMREDPDDIDEVDKHIPEMRCVKGVWSSKQNAEDKKAWGKFETQLNSHPSRLIVLAVNYEAQLSEHIYEFLKELCKEFRVFIIADESTRIGKPGSKRTKRAINLRKLCAYRVILTGTPIIKTPLKIYSQARFLGDDALPFRSYLAFRNRYCIMGGWQGRQVIAYQNLEELSDLIARFSFLVTKEEALPYLPPKVFVKRRVEMTDEQRKAYREMRQEFMTEIQGEEITAPIVLAQMTRLQQILGGYINKDGKIIEIIPPERNPKIQETLQILEDAPGQCIVWFRFREELAAVARSLPKDSFFEFHGSMDDVEKLKVRKAFKRGERLYLLGTSATGGIGIDEFKVANVVVNFSNSFDTELRTQTDDRTHRIGSEMHTSITYYDVIVPNSVDTKILSVLRGNAQLSAKILRQEWREWI